MKELLALSIGFLFLLSCTNNQKQEQEQEVVVVEPEINVESKIDKRTEIDFTVFKDIVLLNPDTVDNDARLMDALKKRQSTRKYAEENLSLEQLSNLLWAAYGINRIDGRRTSPSTYACYPITIYAVFSTGIYEYEPEINLLQAIAEGDYRTSTGEEFMYNAPLNLLFVADMNKYVNFSFIPEDILVRHAMADAAYSSQNIYLYCAASNFATVARVTDIDEPKLLQLLKLDNKKHKILLAQTVGYKLGIK